MKIVSFNINGIRARLHQLQALINKHQPDIIGLQEIKVHNDQFPVADVEAMGYHVYFHGQKGHYGVAMMCKKPAPGNHACKKDLTSMKIFYLAMPRRNLLLHLTCLQA